MLKVEQTERKCTNGIQCVQDFNPCLYVAGENWTKAGGGASATARRGARQVHQQSKVTSAFRVCGVLCLVLNLFIWMELLFKCHFVRDLLETCR